MTETIPADVVTDERAEMLAQHAIHVQGGYSTAEIERKRAESDLAAGGTIDWAKMEAEVAAAIAAKIAAMPTTPTEPTEPPAPTGVQAVDVTAVLASIDQGEALRDRIKAMQAELKVHEDNIKDALGEAVEGTDATGKVVVRYPHRNRTNLIAKRVEALLSPEDLATCQNVTSYRTLLYGES